MTEQFQVGKVYRTRGGDRARVTEIEEHSIYGLITHKTGRTQKFCWGHMGEFHRLSFSPSKYDLLPTPLPDPVADDKAELLAALRTAFAFIDYATFVAEPEGKVRSCGWLDTYNLHERGPVSYDQLRAARAAIAKAERTP